MLRIHDTLTREKVAFIPADPQRVTMYVCGPTVYNYAHIGNARPAVVFDVLFRLLRRLYGEEAVIYARNITDVDDKINAAAIEQGVPISTITDKFAAIYNEDLKALGCLEPTMQPRATDHMAEMAAMIETLIAKDAAYVSDGEVLFDVARYEAEGGDYGALSGRSLDDMIAGARVEVAENKRNAADFVLWKPSKPGEPAWDGPQGLKGRPGWHIECSAMIEAKLGLPIDIHGGGHDLIFPHHTNEIAQSCAAHGARDAQAFARHWMHNGFLDFSGEKMSKSLGNVVLIHDLVKQYPGEVIRWALLSGHYRSPLNWTDEVITQAHRNLNYIYDVLKRTAPDAYGGSASPDDEIVAALADNLNTPLALMRLQQAAQRLNVTTSGYEKAELRAVILGSGALLGLLQQDPETWFESGVDDDLKAKVEALLAERIAARAAKDWPAADRIRDALTALNVVVMDGPTGATWRMKD
jgi:cysteinyl-tRNA synthetase